MIRFIDLKKQVNDWARAFAFYNTSTEKFIIVGSDCIWESWEDFMDSVMVQVAYDHNAPFDIERFKRLCPRWVFNNGGFYVRRI